MLVTAQLEGKVASFQKRLGERVAAIVPPNILFTDNLGFQPSAHHTDETLIRASVSPDILPLLLGFPTLDSYIQARLDISTSIIGAERFPLQSELFVIANSVPQPTLPKYRFQPLAIAKVFGMNYRDKIWRQIPLNWKGNRSGGILLKLSIANVGDRHRDETE